MTLISLMATATARVTAGDTMWGRGSHVESLTNSNFRSTVMKSDAGAQSDATAGSPFNYALLLQCGWSLL